MGVARYRCEVSTEAPMFSTESKHGDLLVVVLPSTAPVIRSALLSAYSFNVELSTTHQGRPPRVRARGLPPPELHLLRVQASRRPRVVHQQCRGWHEVEISILLHLSYDRRMGPTSSPTPRPPTRRRVSTPRGRSCS